MGQAGLPILTEEGKGYCLQEGYKPPPVMFTDGEANAFITAEKLVLLNTDTSFIKNYIDGVTKIKSVLRSNAEDKVTLLSERVAFEENPNGNIPSSFLSSIQTAPSNFSVINVEYCSPETDEITKRDVEPFALINNTGESWYLIA